MSGISCVVRGRQVGRAEGSRVWCREDWWDE